MFKQFGTGAFTDAFDRPAPTGVPIAQSGQLDALVALERIGARRNFTRDEEIYAEGDPSDCWYRVVAGTVRISKLLADGRRHIAEFCFGGDCFGLDNAGERVLSAEAVGEVIVMRYPRRATERLIDENPQLARCLCDLTLRDLAHAQTHMMLLGRMTAPERVASFLLEMSERLAATEAVELPMSRQDIADYLGLTIETVSRTLWALENCGAIGISRRRRIQFRSRSALVRIQQ